MSEDDGLLLNFAAPIANTLRKRNDGKSRHERPRISDNKGTSQRPAASLPSQASTSFQASKQISPPSIAAAPSTQLSIVPRQQTSPFGSRPQTAHTPQASSSAQSAPTAKPSTTPANRNGFISSLFTGGDKTNRGTQKQVTESNSIEAAPTNAPSAGTAFGALGLDPLLVAHLQSSKLSIETPTSIQRNSLPFLLSPESAGRDALLHAQTGSGKTLSYLLPIIQSLLPLCETSWIDRSCLGTIAIILAPTRELAHQIYEVVEKLCNLHLAEKAEDVGEDEARQSNSTRRTRWIVPGLLSGGATRNHEKSRLRKGLPIIVATPGRLLDHLRNTTSLDVGRLQWLVLDEADRLLHLGFEQTLSDIMKAIDGRRRATCEAQRERMIMELGSQHQGQIADKDVMDTFGELWWKHPRRTVLCSATLDEGVQVLAGKSLSSPRVIRGDVEKEATGQDRDVKMQTTMTAPAQLKQNYVIMPTKQRLVVLLALLRQAVSSGKSKVMVFLSCTDSVDFHWSLLGGVKMTVNDEKSIETVAGKENPLKLESDLLPSTSIFKLHGSMTQHERQASLKLFSQSKQSGVLLCTSVASRGLDLDISLVVQMDPPSERGVDEYLHRIGRTARVGVGGESWLLLLPSEEGCVAAYASQMGDSNIITRRESEDILKKGFAAQDLWQSQVRATEVQMAFEKWVLEKDDHTTLARKAYLSHLRAYATHPPSEWQYFSISKLQLGHLAKAFALREAPGVIRSKHKMNRNKALKEADQRTGTQQPGRKRKRVIEAEETVDINDADSSSSSSDNDKDEISRKHFDFARNKATEARMYAKVREMGKLNRQKGILGAYGVDEYQIGV